MSDYGVIEKLRREHSLDSFDCGKEELNRFLKRQAWNNQQSHSAQTYVLAKNLSVLGYYSLAAGSVRHEGAPARVKKGLARHRSRSSYWHAWQSTCRSKARASAPPCSKTP